jgi:hypothetical protein
MGVIKIDDDGLKRAGSKRMKEEKRNELMVS